MAADPVADPVAAKSRFLCAYMSAHPDTLVVYVKHFGQIKGDVSSARMLSIDSKGMDLEYKMKGSPASIQPEVVRVEFDPALLGYEEVKPRLLSMKADANEALGTVKDPQITHFELPFQIWITTSLLLLLIYATSMPPDSHGNFWWLARTLRPGIFPDWTIRPLWCFVFIAHSMEGFYAGSLARKHNMPWHIAMAWVGTVTIFGFPVLLRLHRLIQQARIESIMKGN